MWGSELIGDHRGLISPPDCAPGLLIRELYRIQDCKTARMKGEVFEEVYIGYYIGNCRKAVNKKGLEWVPS